jgi:hypothetical protein
MKNIKSFRLFENSDYISELNKDSELSDWLMSAKFEDEDDSGFYFYDNDYYNIITPYGEKLYAKFNEYESEFTGEGDFSFWSDFLDECGILYQVFGHGRGGRGSTAYENCEWDNEISNVEFSKNFNAPKLIVRIIKESPLLATKIYNLCDDPTKELIRIKLELSGMDPEEVLNTFKGGSLLNRFGDI